MVALADKYQALKRYMNAEGQFTLMHGKRQKNMQALMLEYLSQMFESGTQYTEPQVNDILNQHHTFNDAASLRRLMFGKKLIDRTIDGRAYWLRD